MKVIWWFAVLVLSTVSLPSPSTFNIDCRGGNGGFNGGGGGGGCGNLLSGLQIHRGGVSTIIFYFLVLMTPPTKTMTTFSNPNCTTFWDGVSFKLISFKW